MQAKHTAAPINCLAACELWVAACTAHIAFWAVGVVSGTRGLILCVRCAVQTGDPRQLFGSSPEAHINFLACYSAAPINCLAVLCKLWLAANEAHIACWAVSVVSGARGLLLCASCADQTSTRHQLFDSALHTVAGSMRSPHRLLSSPHHLLGGLCGWCV